MLWILKDRICLFLRGVGACLLAVLMLAAPAALRAQGYFGTVSGVITDPSGAVVPNATVTLIDQEKGFTFDGKSDGVGRYLFRAVPPGVYKVLAEAPGFVPQEKTNIRVAISGNPSSDLQLKIGSTQSRSRSTPRNSVWT